MRCKTMVETICKKFLGEFLHLISRFWGVERLGRPLFSTSTELVSILGRCGMISETERIKIDLSISCLISRLPKMEILPRSADGVLTDCQHSVSSAKTVRDD